MTRVLVVLPLMFLALPAGAQTIGEWDTSGDGVIDAAEFRAGVAEDGALERWDRDEDAQLDPAEFASGLYALWDRNDNGDLSVDEWDTAVDNWFGEEAVNLSVAAWDTDGDGIISREEFASATNDAGLFTRLEADEDADELLGEDELVEGFFGVADVDEDAFLGEDEDWFVTDLLEALNTPEDDALLAVGEPEPADQIAPDVEPLTEDAGPVDEPVSRVFTESFVGLPMPCGTEGGEECRDTAERLCSVLGLGEPIDLLAEGGELYALRCDDGV